MCDAAKLTLPLTTIVRARIGLLGALAGVSTLNIMNGGELDVTNIARTDTLSAGQIRLATLSVYSGGRVSNLSPTPSNLVTFLDTNIYVYFNGFYDFATLLSPLPTAPTVSVAGPTPGHTLRVQRRVLWLPDHAHPRGAKQRHALPLFAPHVLPLPKEIYALPDTIALADALQ